jgi:hypothetical protein
VSIAAVGRGDAAAFRLRAKVLTGKIDRQTTATRTKKVTNFFIAGK